MKRFLLFSLFPIFSLGQEMPGFIPDSIKTGSIQTRVGVHFDSCIAYTRSCYWPLQQNFFILGKTGNKWKLLRCTVTYANQQKDSVIRIKTKNIHLSNAKLQDVFSVWAKASFPNLDKDSLAYDKFNVDDKSYHSLGVTDGCADIFEFYSASGQKVLDVYAASEFQECCPTSARADFIRCRNYFIKMILSK